MDEKLLSQLAFGLSILQNIDANVVSELCEVAVQSLLGRESKPIISIAGSLNLDRADVEQCVLSLSCLYVEANRCQVSIEVLTETLTTLGVNEQATSAITGYYLTVQDLLSKSLKNCDNGPPRFKSLQWRLESQLGSRSRLADLEPRVVMCVNLENSGKLEKVPLVSDLPNIAKWSKAVEDALGESRTPHARRIHRAIV